MALTAPLIKTSKWKGKVLDMKAMKFSFEDQHPFITK